ncbi:MAG: anti-sigma F factor [Clostridiales bacterium]|jgi:stage II sporulation protein AB (anti-sigma F factor)|nr:anti-sigma F factor [Clostridiales bacterium]
MGYDNEMTTIFTGISENEAFARTVIAAFVSRFNPTVAEITDVKTAVSEAVTNAIIHGYCKDTGMVEVMCAAKNRDIYIEVKDKGVGIADIDKAMTPLFTSKPDMERSGMGFTVMEAFMDSVTVESAPGCGTTVVMKKRLLG